MGFIGNVSESIFFVGGPKQGPEESCVLKGLLSKQIKGMFGGGKLALRNLSLEHGLYKQHA